MNDFDFDCLQKKRLAQQAKYRKRGSKSKKCTMSTDYMTTKQWKERCGKLVTIQTDKPVSWATFKELSKQTQEEYLHGLMESYGANASSLAAMFHVKPLTVRRYITSRGLDISFPVGHSMTFEQRRMWEEFLSGGEKSVYVDLPQEQNTEPDDKLMNMSGFSVRFSGKIDVNMISNSLISILGNDVVGEVEIKCNLVSRTSGL